MTLREIGSSILDADFSVPAKYAVGLLVNDVTVWVMLIALVVGSCWAATHNFRRLGFTYRWFDLVLDGSFIGGLLLWFLGVFP